MHRVYRVLQSGALLALVAGAAGLCFSQESPDPNLRTYFKDYVGLTDDQIAAIRSGTAVAKVRHSRIPQEIFVFGAVYINAAPESYLKFSRDFDRLRRLPGYLAIGEFSDPPQPSDLKGFAFDTDDIKSLKNCKLGNCEIQMPKSSIDELQKSIDLSAPGAEDQVNQLLQKTVLERLVAYQQEGNQALGVYDDKKNPTEVSKQFKYMLSYSRALATYLPEF